MPTELEMKLRIPSVTVADRILSDKMVTDYLASEIKTTPMVSRYYDTETSALLDLRWSLRLRQEGEKSVLSLKTSSADVSGDLFVRKEWQVLSDTVEDGVPLLVEQGAPERSFNLFKTVHLLRGVALSFQGVQQRSSFRMECWLSLL